jgi:lysophospholipase L1-like esterase
LNAGVNGYGSAEEAYVLEHGFESAGRPAIVFVMFFANDVDADYDGVIKGALADRDRRWGESLRQIDRMKQFADAHGVALVVAAIPSAEQVFSHASQDYYQRVLRQFSDREGIRFVNLAEHFDENEARSFYWDWDPHFTPRGHRAVAEALYAETAGLYK